jgi:hypothetical protein
VKVRRKRPMEKGIRKEVVLLLALTLASSMLAVSMDSRVARAQINPVYFSVEPVAIVPLMNINASVNGLETPSWPSPVGQCFNISLYLNNATLTNVPLGLMGIAVELNFTSILGFAQPVAYTDLITNSSCVFGDIGLTTGDFLFIRDGLYTNVGVKKSYPFAGATQVMIGCTETLSPVVPWNETKGNNGQSLIATVEFNITSQPGLGFPNATGTLDWVTAGTGATDASDNGIYCDVIGGTVQIDTRTLFTSMSIACSPSLVSVGSSVTCTATVSPPNATGTITWSTSSSTGSFNSSICTLSSGSCSTTYADTSPGSVTIAASYSGDSDKAPSSGSSTLIVTSSGPVYYSENYTSVQAAISAAPSEATVIVAAGFYSGCLSLNETLTIIGEKDAPVFSGGGSGVYLTLWPGASGSIVAGMEVTDYNDGLLIINASNCRVYDNIMSSIGSNGIVLEGESAVGNLIYCNVFQDTPTPINLTASATSDTIYDNIISSQSTLILNIGASGNSVYGNSLSAGQIIVNVMAATNNVIYNNNFQATATTAPITVLTAGGNTWDNGSASGGNYWSDYQSKYPNAAEIDSTGIWNMPYVIDSKDTDHYPLMKPWTPTAGHDVAVISVVVAKTVIGQGFSGNLRVGIADKGRYTETFNVAAYSNSTVISIQQVINLNAASQTALTFTWTTTGLAYGSYSISAYAGPVPGEADMSNNNFTLGIVKVTIAGDIDGDGYVFLGDLGLMAAAWTSMPGSPNWNPNADIVGEGQVFLGSLGVMAQHWTQHYS